MSQRRYTWTVIALLGIFLSTTAEDCVGLKSAAERLADTIDAAIAQIASESKNWRATLANLESQLAKDASDLAKDTLRQVNDVSQRTIATAGTEIRCNVDFLADRVRTRLSNISRGLRKLPPIDVGPAICQIVPEHVDRRLRDDQVSILSIYGYDFPADGKDVRVLIQDVADAKTDVTAKALNVPHHYLATLNLSATGIYADLKDTSRSVMLMFKDNILGRIPITDSFHDLHVETFTQVSPRTNHPKAVATVDSNYVLVGGGCRAEWLGGGQLLTASYPQGSSWICQSKDHAAADPSSISAFALGIPKSENIEVRMTQATGASEPHPTAAVAVPDGFQLVGGGCATSWQDGQPNGNLLVDSFPTSNQWHCEGKDHGSPSPATITAYAIGIPKLASVKVFTAFADSDRAAHPAIAVTLPREAQSAAVTGGGCDVTYAGSGSMLTASFPTGQSWECRAKDHGTPDPARVRAYVIGLSRVPR